MTATSGYWPKNPMAPPPDFDPMKRIAALEAILRQIAEATGEVGDDGSCPVCMTYSHKAWCWYPMLVAWDKEQARATFDNPADIAADRDSWRRVCERLGAENARLREALKVALREMELWRGENSCECEGGECVCGLPRLSRSIEQASAALAQGEATR